MTYAEARRRVRRARLLGWAIWAASFIAGLVLFIRTIDASPFELRSLRALIVWIYEHVPLFPVLWQYAPAIDSRTRPAVSLVVIAIPVLGYVIAALILQWAGARAARLRRIDEQIEDEMIRESIRPGERRTVAEIRHRIEVPKLSFWKMFHELYLSQTIVQIIGALVAAAILFWLGWS